MAKRRRPAWLRRLSMSKGWTQAQHQCHLISNEALHSSRQCLVMAKNTVGAEALWLVMPKEKCHWQSRCLVLANDRLYVEIQCFIVPEERPRPESQRHIISKDGDQAEASCLAVAKSRLQAEIQGQLFVEEMQRPGFPSDFCHDSTVFQSLRDVDERGHLAAVRYALKPGDHVLVANLGRQVSRRCLGFDTMPHAGAFKGLQANLALLEDLRPRSRARSAGLWGCLGNCSVSGQA